MKGARGVRYLIGGTAAHQQRHHKELSMIAGKRSVERILHCCVVDRVCVSVCVSRDMHDSRRICDYRL